MNHISDNPKFQPSPDRPARVADLIPLLEDVQAMHRAQKFGFEFNFKLGNLICVLEILLSRIEESGFLKKCTEQESRDFKRVCDFFGLLNQGPDSVREGLRGKLEQMIMARMRLQVSGVLCGGGMAF